MHAALGTHVSFLFRGYKYPYVQGLKHPFNLFFMGTWGPKVRSKIAPNREILGGELVPFLWVSWVPETSQLQEGEVSRLGIRVNRITG